MPIDSNIKKGTVKSIQAFSITINGSSSNTATLSNAIVVANSYITGVSQSMATDDNTMEANVVITNTTTITATRVNAGANNTIVKGFVVEYHSL